MKNQLILWISSLIIVFLIGYTKNVTSKEYPVTGTFGIDGKKVSYKLDKVSYDKISYRNIIISDIKGVSGKIIWILDNKKNENDLKEIERGLAGEIPVLNPGQHINYKIILKYIDKHYEIPEKNFVTLTFWGNMPSLVNILHFVLLYGGLLMSIRCMLELFNNNKNVKKFLVIGCVMFITLTILIHPLYNSYKLGAINKDIPNITELVEPLYLIILSFWLIGAVFIFNKKYVNTVTALVSSFTILLYFLL